MASLNKVFLIGNLTRDPELRYTPSGLAVATFTVAANRSYKTQSGEKKDEAAFIRVVVWARRAELCGEYLNKGSLVFVEGRLQSRNWQGQDGAKRTTIEIVANNIQFLGIPKTALKSSKTFSEETQEPVDIVPDLDTPNEETGQDTKGGHEDEAPF